MRHSSIIPDKDLTCKIDFNGIQQQQSDRHTRTQAYKKEHIVLTAKVISIYCAKGFCDLQFYGYTATNDDNNDRNNNNTMCREERRRW